MEGVSAVEEFSQAIFTPHGETGCYGVAHWHRCCAGISVRGVAGCVTSGAIDPLQSDSYPQSSAALHLSMHAHTHIHTHTLSTDIQLCCVSNRKMMIKECFQSVIWCVSGKIVLHMWGVYLNMAACLHGRHLKLITGCWKFSTFTHL